MACVNFARLQEFFPKGLAGQKNRTQIHDEKTANSTVERF